MKILCIVPSPYIGGLQIITTQFFERFSDRITSHFLLTNWSDGEFAKRLDELTIPYSYSWLGMFSRKLDPYNLKMTIHCLSKLPILYMDFLKLVRDYRPDVIYMALYHEIILLLPLLLSLRVPIIYHAHNLLPTTGFHRKDFLLWGKAVDHYIAISNSVKSSIEALGVAPNRISLLYNGIDLARFPVVELGSSSLEEQYNWPKETIIIGITGQMMPGKGHSDFLKAARIVVNEFPSARFVIGGKKNEPYYGQLRREITELDLDRYVVFTGWQTNMSTFYGNLDIFVFPTVQEWEGFGLVIAEAMATGIPTIVTRSGGASEVIADGISGLLVDRQKPEQLAAAIRTLILSPSARKSLGKEGRRRVETCFNLSKQTRQLELILTSVVNNYGN